MIFIYLLNFLYSLPLNLLHIIEYDLESKPVLCTGGLLVLINYAVDGYCRFIDTLGMSLTMPNKKYFFDFFTPEDFYRP